MGFCWFSNAICLLANLPAVNFIAQSAKDNFGSLLASGVFSMIVFQVILNISMTIGLAPAGVFLTLISYGKSALLTNFIAIGIRAISSQLSPKAKVLETREWFKLLVKLSLLVVIERERRFCLEQRHE